MDDATREYQAIVWIKGSAKPPVHLTVEARDVAEARKQIVEQFGEQIVLSVWNEDDARKRWPRPAMDADEIREYMAIVWTKDPATPGQRITVNARNGDEARKLVQEQFGEEITCSIWNEEDANRTR